MAKRMRKKTPNPNRSSGEHSEVKNMSEENNEGTITVVYMNRLNTALELLGQVIVDMKLDPEVCKTMVVQQNYEGLVGMILLAIIDTATLSMIPDSTAVALTIDSLTDAELALVNAIPQVGKVKDEAKKKQENFPKEERGAKRVIN